MMMMMMGEQPPIIKNWNAKCVSTVSCRRRRYHTTYHYLVHALLSSVIILCQNGCLAWTSSMRLTCARKMTTTRSKWHQSMSRAFTLRPTSTQPPDHCFYHRHATKSTNTQQVLRLQASFFDDGSDVAVPLIVVVALILGVAANSWINQLVTGKEPSSSSSSSGLGNFLRDGSGYNKSGFQMSDTDRALSQGDPLPWLQLPQLDFVSVAGQEEEDINNKITGQLEALRIQINQALDAKNIEEAKRLREELEYRMQQSGMEFRNDVGADGTNE